MGYSSLDFDTAVGSITVTATSSDGRVACGTDEFDDFICYARTGRFGVLDIGTFDKEFVPLSELAGIGDALVATYP